MKRMLISTVLLVVLSVVCSQSIASDVPSFLQSISVTVKSGNTQGSGTIVTRTMPDGSNVSFVWTAGHVVSNLRHVRKIIDGKGGTRYLVEFKDPQIVAERYQDGERVGQQTLDCRVIRYSDYEYGEDLAILAVKLRDVYPISVCSKFPSDSKYIPPVGVELGHCGSLLGQFGSNSYTTGVLSQTGRMLEGSGANKKVFDQVTAVAFPGSSGGGVYLRNDGTYIGMLTQGINQLQGFNFIVPFRRMHKWAKSVNAEWAVNLNAEVPGYEEILEHPVESEGVFREGIGNYNYLNDDNFRVIPLTN